MQVQNRGREGENTSKERCQMLSLSKICLWRGARENFGNFYSDQIPRSAPTSLTFILDSFSPFSNWTFHYNLITPSLYLSPFFLLSSLLFHSVPSFSLPLFCFPLSYFLSLSVPSLFCFLLSLHVSLPLSPYPLSSSSLLSLLSPLSLSSNSLSGSSHVCPSWLWKWQQQQQSEQLFQIM